MGTKRTTPRLHRARMALKLCNLRYHLLSYNACVESTRKTSPFASRKLSVSRKKPDSRVKTHQGCGWDFAGPGLLPPILGLYVSAEQQHQWQPWSRTFSTNLHFIQLLLFAGVKKTNTALEKHIQNSCKRMATPTYIPSGQGLSSIHNMVGLDVAPMTGLLIQILKTQMEQLSTSARTQLEKSHQWRLAHLSKASSVDLLMERSLYRGTITIITKFRVPLVLQGNSGVILQSGLQGESAQRGYSLTRLFGSPWPRNWRGFSTLLFFQSLHHHSNPMADLSGNHKHSHRSESSCLLSFLTLLLCTALSYKHCGQLSQLLRFGQPSLTLLANIEVSASSQVATFQISQDQLSHWPSLFQGLLLGGVLYAVTHGY